MMLGIQTLSLSMPAWAPMLASVAPRLFRSMPPIHANSGEDQRLPSPTAAMITPSAPLWARSFAVDASRIASLTAGWDGAGSMPISPQILLMAQYITFNALDGMRDAVAPYVVPAGDGSLQLEWHEVHGELELHIDPNASLSFWARDHRNELEMEDYGEKALASFYRWAPWVAANHSNVRNVSVTEKPFSFRIAA